VPLLNFVVYSVHIGVPPTFPPMTKQIRVVPEVTIPIPVDLTPQEAKTLHERAKAAFKTMEFLAAMGLEPKKENMEAAKREAERQFAGSPAAGRRPFNAETTLWLDKLLNDYNNSIVEDTIRLKTYVTTKLIEESEGEKAADRLRALESLGRLTQLGMFADKVEISVNNKSTDELKEELNKKLARYMGKVEEVQAEKVKETVQVIDLDIELGRKKNINPLEGEDLDD
jgi:hypothetical protein